MHRYPEGPKKIEQYRSVRDDTFLTICHQNIATFYHLWRSKFNGELLPKRSDFDPAEMVRLLPYLFMVDQETEDNDYRYRLVGTNEVLIRRTDPTGKLVKDFFADAGMNECLANYDAVFQTGCYVFDHSIVNFGGPISYQDQVLLLPTSSDGLNVDIVFGIGYQISNAEPNIYKFTR